MKIDRLIGILSILLQEEKTTAPELAERFEVSRRTINRDIEALCKAGIPIRTAQGIGGGISIMDGYRIDRTILTSKDMQMILAGLRSLDSVSGSRYYGQLMEKIQSGSSEFISGRDFMLIDLSSWYKASLAPKIEVIQSAIENRKLLEFKYYAPSGESSRTIEPYYLVFQWSSWYVWGCKVSSGDLLCADQSGTERCKSREDYRLFKLNRMDGVKESKQNFICRDVPLPDLSNEKIFPGGIRVKALFTADMKWRLVEEFGPHCFTETDDGRLLFTADYTNMDNLVTWLLTFGPKAEVLEPVEVRDIIRRSAEKILQIYTEDLKEI
ncbi:MAG: YafY family protein [Eubacteriales bacterium]|nr:YafY family protein [Eubacteriales bacterium]